VGAGVLFVGGLVIVGLGVDRLRRLTDRPASPLVATTFIVSGTAMCLLTVALIAILG
jgi:hypothetical protein